jgi:hypothetical protein
MGLPVPVQMVKLLAIRIKWHHRHDDLDMRDRDVQAFAVMLSKMSALHHLCMMLMATMTRSAVSAAETFSIRARLLGT